MPPECGRAEQWAWAGGCKLAVGNSWPLPLPPPPTRRTRKSSSCNDTSLVLLSIDLALTEKNDVLDGRHNGLLGRGSGFLVEAHLWPPKSCRQHLWTVHIYCLEHSPIYELTSIKAMFFSSFQTLASLLQNINQGSGHQCTVGDGDVYQINWKRSYISKVLNWWSWEH